MGFFLSCVCYTFVRVCLYEGCSNINASSVAIFVTYMLRPNSLRFCKGLYVTINLAPDLKKITVY